MLVTWLPRAAPFVLAGATHMLHVENPRAMAERQEEFFARHPIARSRCGEALHSNLISAEEHSRNAATGSMRNPIPVQIGGLNLN